MTSINNSGNSQLRYGVILNYAKILATICISLLYTPYLLRMLGQVEYGLFSLAFSFIGAFAFLDLGMGNTNVRFTAKLIKEGDREKEAMLHGMFLKLYLVLGLIALALGGIIYFSIESFFGKSMSVEEVGRLKSLLLIVVPYVSLILPLSIFTYIVRAYERFVFERLVRLIQIVINPIIVIGLLWLGVKSVGIVAGIVILSIVSSTILMIYAIIVLNVRVNLKGFDRKILTQIFGFSAFTMLGVISYRIDDSAGQLILGRVSGAVDVAVFALAFMLFFNFRIISQAIISLMLAVLSKVPENQDQIKVFNSYFVSVGRIQVFVLSLFVLGFVFFGKPFIMLWAGSEYVLSYHIALLLIVSSFFNLTQSVAKTILSARFKHQFISGLAISISVLNVGLSYLLAQRYGPVGIAYAFAFNNLLSLLILNIYYSYFQEISVMKYWMQVARILPSMILPVAFGLFCLLVVDAYSWVTLSLGVLVFSILYALSTFFIGLNGFEKTMILSPVRSLQNRLFR